MLYNRHNLTFALLETIVEPNQQHYPWYHQKFRRVPTIDECYTDDPICLFEAQDQFKRDKYVATFCSIQSTMMLI